MKLRLFGRTIEIRNNATVSLPSVYDDSAWLSYLLGKGHPVNATTAVKVAAVIRCVDVVAKTMASLPLHLYRQTPEGKTKATDHPAYKLLWRIPNPETTAYEFWHMYVFNLMLTRGAYAKIVRDPCGYVRELWNVPTAVVTPGRNTVNGERYISVDLGGGNSEILRSGDFMFTPGLRFGSASTPEDPVAVASEVLGLTLALNSYAKDFFENGSNLGGLVYYPTALSDQAYQRFKESWQSTYAGILNQHKIGFLEDGAKFEAMGRNPNDAQALESRKFEVTEICRLFGVPPHKVFDLDRATFSNIEQQNIEYVQESVTPMAVRLEQTIYKDLLTAREQETHYAKFAVNGLLRGDMAGRTAYYNSARQNGWMCANEIRELEDMDRIPAEQGGDIYAVNGNLIPLTAVPQNLPKGATKNGA
ncbi:MAG TPA: phage portal protein [Candidatus Hydrogenedentes bacterium]|nr:phage portal protein [Candidatus Hydrogenedentota bacterium]